MSDETSTHLYRQLIKLGDMIGDGLHLEPGGSWITKDYRRVAKALGYDLPKQERKNNSAAINERMAKRVTEVACGQCGGQLKQNRKGSKRATCQQCHSVWKLLK